MPGFKMQLSKPSISALKEAPCRIEFRLKNGRRRSKLVESADANALLAYYRSLDSDRRGEFEQSIQTFAGFNEMFEQAWRYINSKK